MEQRMNSIASACIDTNILIYHINGHLTKNAEKFLLDTLKQGAYISIISRIETLGWSGHTDESLRLTQKFLDKFIECPLERDIAETCITLRQNFRIKLPDAIIAATALSLRLPLMTRNVHDFKAITSLQAINPFDA